MSAPPSAEFGDPRTLARYLHLFASLSQGVVFLDGEGGIVEANAAAGEILGLSQEQIRGRSVFDPRWQMTREDGTSFPLDEYPVVVAFQTSRPVRDVLVAVSHTSGERRWIRLSAIPLVDHPEVPPTLVVAIFEDVTEARRTTEALRESEERFRLIAECSSDVLYEWDLRTNRAEYFGKLRPEMPQIGMSADVDVWLAELHEDERAELLDDIRDALAHRDVFVREHRLRSPFGWRHVVTRGVIVRDAEGRPVRWIGSSTDISQQRNAEREKEETLNLFRAVIEGAGDPIYVKDLDGRFRMLNAAAANRLGVATDAALGKHNRDFLPAELAATFELYEQEVIRTGESMTYEAPGWGAASDRTYLTTKLPLYGASGEITGTITIARDVTMLKWLEIRLRHSQKMEAIGRLAGGIAHDFNNLLMVIIGCCSEVHDQVAVTNPVAADSVADALKAADRGALLTRQLLAFSRRQLLEPRVTDLNAIVAGAERMFGRIIGEDVILRTDLAPDLGAVHVDPGQMEQVLLNLVVNARDAMPRGGNLTIRTANIDATQPGSLPHRDVSPGRYVGLIVSDTGVGMNAETLANVFEPFFTTKAQGTGLGLATVYGIVKQSGGEIWAESEPGTGTSFTVLFPLHPLATDAATEPPPPRATTGNELLVLVEDERSLRELLARSLARQGYEVVVAASAAEALAAIDRLTSAPALLITDVIMPEMDGHSLALKVRERLPDLHVLYMSGFADHAVLDATRLAPEDRFLQKPFTPATLARTVRLMLDAQR